MVPAKAPSATCSPNRSPSALFQFSSSPMMSRLLAAALSLLVLSTGAGHTQETPEKPDGVTMAKARLYLADFQKAVDGDEEKAQEAFDVLIEMPPFIQQGFGRYLEGEWQKRAKDYMLAASRNASRSGPAVTQDVSMEDRARARADQEELLRIRSIGNETQMKKELKSKGWPAMQALLAIFKRSGGRASSGGSDPSVPAKQVAALNIGKYRAKFHRHFGETLAQSPEEELGLKPDQPEKKEEKKVKISATAADRAILKQNEDLFSQIGKAEADGIRQLNEWRIAAGMAPLLVDPKLCAAARDHSQDMAKHGFFSHTSPIEGKKSFTQRAKNFGTSARGENIAVNSSSLSANMAWFYSPGHHKNMFREGYTTIGFGAHGRHFTQMFR